MATEHPEGQLFDQLVKFALLLLASTPESGFNCDLRSTRSAVCNTWSAHPSRAVRNGAVFAYEAGGQSEPALSSVGEAHTVNSADQWNVQVQELFPDQPALRINQLDLLDQSANPLLAEFWQALQTSLKAFQQKGSEFLYSIRDGELRPRDNQDAKEQWYLKSQDEDGASGEPVEMLAGMPSLELPAETLPPEHNSAVLRVPAVLLRTYKSELLDFVLRERLELAAILERQKDEKGKDVQVKWEHRVLRRSFDGDFVKQQGLRFHHDSLPDDIEHGVLWTCTVLTVLENHDAQAKENPRGSSVERAGTVFKLDKLFGSGKRHDPHDASEKPKQGDGFMYWHSRSSPGIATIFSNSEDTPRVDMDDDIWDDPDSGCDYDAYEEMGPIQYSWTPQMWHSVAEVQGQKASDRQTGRSRTVLQTKITFCSSPDASMGEEIIERLKIIGLGPYLNETLEKVEHRIINDFLGPFTFEEFVSFYGDMDEAMARWEVAAPASVDDLSR